MDATWYNSQLPTTIIGIYMIFQVSQKWYFPHLRQFVKWQYIHGSLYCFRSFRKEFGEEVRCCSIVPSAKNDLGGILVIIKLTSNDNSTSSLQSQK